jgi:hypothetical protein
MGIYRYQGQRNGKLKDRNPQDTTADWQESSPSPMFDRAPKSGWKIQRWGHQGQRVGAAMKNLSIIVTGGVVVVSVVALAGAWRSGSRVFDRIYEAFTAPQPEPQVEMKPMLVQQLRGISELTTAVFAMQTVVPASRDRTLGGYVIGRTTLLYIAYGEVRAGVDLSSIQPSDIQVNGDTVSVRLPPPQILDSKIDVNRSKVYDYDRGFLGLGPDAAPELQDLAAQTTLQHIVESACDQGVLETASTQARETVGQLLKTAGYVTSIIEVQPPAPETCAGSVPTDLELSLPEDISQ